MQNPDNWTPGEQQSPPPAPRRGALIALIVVILLVAGAMLLTRTLRGLSQVQDCALSGRRDCVDLTQH